MSKEAIIKEYIKDDIEPCFCDGDCSLPKEVKENWQYQDCIKHCPRNCGIS